MFFSVFSFSGRDMSILRLSEQENDINLFCYEVIKFQYISEWRPSVLYVYCTTVIRQDKCLFSCLRYPRSCWLNVHARMLVLLRLNNVT